MADQGIIKISVRSLDRGQFSYELAPNTTVASLKEKVAADTHYPSSRVRLLHRGRELSQDAETLAQLDLPENVVFHCALRAPPTDQQRRAPAGDGRPTGRGDGGGVHGPFVFGRGQPGGNGPGVNINPGDFMQFMQEGGLGGIGGIFGSVSIEGPGVRVGGGPSPDQLNGIQEAVSRMFGGGGAGRGGGGTGGRNSRNNRNDAPTTNFSVPPHAGFGEMPFIHPFGPSGQPIPGLSSETVARGGDPIVNSNGEYTQRSVFGGLDEMLLRLQNGNMARDSGPALFGATRDSIAPGNSTDAWAQAARTFLRSCRTILSNTSLNRETLAEVNRIFSAAGLQPLPLGVRSFPIDADENLDDDGNVIGSGGGSLESGLAREDSEGSEDDDLPDLIDSDDSEYSSQNESLDASEYSSDYYEEEEEEYYGGYGPRGLMHAIMGSEMDTITDEDDEEDDDDYYDEDEEDSDDDDEDDEDDDDDDDDDEDDDDWETDEGSADSEHEAPSLQEMLSLLPPQIREAVVSMIPADMGEQGMEDEIRYRLQAEAERMGDRINEEAVAAATGRTRGNAGSDTGIDEDSQSGNGSGDSSPPPLISDPDEEVPQPRVPSSTGRATRGAGSGLPQQQGQTQQPPPARGRDSTTGANANIVDSDDESMPGLLSEDDSMPELLSEDDSESDGSSEINFRYRSRGAAPAPAQQTSNRRSDGAGGSRTDSAWFRAMPDDDLILVAAVTTGELARRFMSVLGQETNPVQENAMIMRLATRLRSLSSLEGIGRMDLARQISLVGRHVTRIAATAAELGRTMDYLHSAFANNNLYFLQMIPGYIGFENDRAVSNMSIMRTGPNASDVVGGGFVPGNGVSNMHVGVRIMPVNVGGAGGGTATAGAGAGAGAGTNNTTTAGGTAAAGGAGNTSGNASGQSPHTGPGGRFVFSSLGGQAPAGGGAPPAGQTPAQASSLSSLSAIARHFVNSTVQDIPSLTGEIAAAISGTLSQSIPEAIAQNSTGAAASMIASRTTDVVDEVVRRHFSQIVDAPEVQQHSEQVRELLGVDIADLLRNISTTSQTGQQQGEEEQQQQEREEQTAAPSAPAAATAATTKTETARAPSGEPVDVAEEVRRAWVKRSDTLAADGAAPVVEKDEKTPAATAEENKKQQEASTSASQDARQRPGGPSLPSRSTAPGGPSLPARRTRAKTATPTPASAAPTDTADTASAPAPTAAAAGDAASGLPAGLGDLLGGSGGAGGLGGMLQSMMSNPAIGELARNPSMQQAASQLFSGSGGGGAGGGADGAGGGLDIGALMSTAGPMLSQLMGGGMAGSAAAPSSTTPSASQPARGSNRARRSPAPAPTAASNGGDLDVTLAAALTAEEATRWKSILEADDETAQKAAAGAGARQEGGEEEIMGYSDAYLAAMPPRAASGLLQGILGGQD